MKIKEVKRNSEGNCYLVTAEVKTLSTEEAFELTKKSSQSIDYCNHTINGHFCIEIASGLNVNGKPALYRCNKCGKTFHIIDSIDDLTDKDTEDIIESIILYRAGYCTAKNIELIEDNYIQNLKKSTNFGTWAYLTYLTNELSIWMKLFSENMNHPVYNGYGTKPINPIDAGYRYSPANAGFGVISAMSPHYDGFKPGQEWD